jgi:hypothetical protein
MKPSTGLRTMRFFGFAPEPRDPSNCIGFALQIISVGVTCSELDSGPISSPSWIWATSHEAVGDKQYEPLNSNQDFLLRGGGVVKTVFRRERVLQNCFIRSCQLRCGLVWFFGGREGGGKEGGGKGCGGGRWGWA